VSGGDIRGGSVRGEKKRGREGWRNGVCGVLAFTPPLCFGGGVCRWEKGCVDFFTGGAFWGGVILEMTGGLTGVVG